ncbi:MAG: phosphoadenosine phosphosulfate reductase domain-containing protein [Candidatus Heimdallarchaeaceae archaeon]
MRKMKAREEIHIVNFSGGKDSTAMLLFMLENNYPIDYVVFCDTGVEYPEIYENINKMEKLLKNERGISITVLKDKHDMLYYMTDYKRVRGKYKGIPYSFPTPRNRWCTSKLKLQPINKFRDSVRKDGGVFDYVGYNISEHKRFSRTAFIRTQKHNSTCISPLLENGINGKTALELCYRNGFTFNGLYEYIDRASCWCCPFKKLGEFKHLIMYYPEFWDRIKEIERSLKDKGVWLWKFAYISGKPTSCGEIEKLLGVGE